MLVRKLRAHVSMWANYTHNESNIHTNDASTIIERAGPTMPGHVRTH